MRRGNRVAQSLGVYDLHEKEFLGVDGARHGAEALVEDHVGVGDAAVGGRWVCPCTSSDVECVEADAEVWAVDCGDDVPGLFPRVDVRAPAEAFVGEAHGG